MKGVPVETPRVPAYWRSDCKRLRPNRFDARRQESDSLRRKLERLTAAKDGPLKRSQYSTVGSRRGAD
jgi:hypothetical protein